jgi:hypothetical protein
VIGGLLPELKKYFENAKELYKPNMTYETVGKTLRDYVDQTGIVEDQLTCLKKIIAAGHGTVLREITRLLFEKKSKTRTLWLCGVANSGKSIFIRLLDLIFASDEVDWRGP